MLGARVGFRILQIAVIALVAGTAAGLAGVGPLSWLRSSKSHASTSNGDSPTSSRPGGPTSTTPGYLESRSYERGDCVTWDQTSSDSARTTHVVPCTAEHLVEISGKVDLASRFDHYPTSAEWDAVFAHDCLAPAEGLLGASLDGNGRFAPTGIYPTTESWTRGDRIVWCAIELRGDKDGMQIPFTEEVRHASQTLLDPIGSCWTTNVAAAIPCAKAHEVEVAGYTKVSAKLAQPPGPDDDAAWQRLVGDACQVIVHGYLGRAPTGDEQAGWFPIERTSWAAGRRTVECTIARYRNGKVVPTAGSLKH